MESESVIFKTKTRYASVSITRNANTLELRSGTEALQSLVDINQPQRLAMKNLAHLMGVLLFLPAPRNILLLGTGGGSLIHFLKFHYPECQLTSVDLDAELQAIMHQQMLLPVADEHLHYVIDDAAHFLHHCDRQFDLILVDIFNGSQSPQWLQDSQNIQQMYALLSDQGAIAYNLLIDSEHAFNLFYRNLTRVFAEQTLSIPVEGYDNLLTYGFRYRPLQRDMSSYIQQAADMSDLHDINYHEVLAAIFTNNPIGSGVI